MDRIRDATDSIEREFQLGDNVKSTIRRASEAYANWQRYIETVEDVIRRYESDCERDVSNHPLESYVTIISKVSSGFKYFLGRDGEARRRRYLFAEEQARQKCLKSKLKDIRRVVFESESTNSCLILIRRVKEVAYSFYRSCLLYTSPSPRDRTRSRMPSSA